MPKKKIFISYQYQDKDLKDHLVRQAHERDSQFSINDSSLLEEQPDDKWYAEANRRIGACDVFIVILGQNTFSAKGVLREVSMAKGLNRYRFQLKPKKRAGPSLPVADAGEVVPWKWRNLEKWLSTDRSRISRS